jgi:tryptophan-rich sensory protein
MKKIKGIIISIAIPQIVGMSSALLTAGTMDIYNRLKIPAFAPPGWVFGPAWTILYALMGYASYRIWQKRANYDVKSALTYYGIQLFFNFAWSLIFFRFALRGIAFFEILILLLLIIITTVKFSKIDRIAAYLMFPYIGWVSFAMILNYAVWVLNK